MATSFYFYDLETSSGSARDGRVMQFAGQRTDEFLQPVGEPHNVLVQLPDDMLPDPYAILVHGVTPQHANSEGLTEAEFAKFFNEEIATPGTVFVGFNNIRFDDEFMRRVNYRTFYDPYRWHWVDGRGRWDLLDPIRMMRALRPEGLKWPIKDGKPTVKLELLAKENGVLHENAHDALSDVQALLELAQRFKAAQPKLFDYLVTMRSKKQVAQLVEQNKPFVYTSGKYSSKHEKTAVVHPLFKHPRRDSAVVYNLLFDPTPWLDKPVEELIKHWQVRYGDDLEPLPVKTMQYNRCPAVAPLSVIDEATAKRLDIDMALVDKHQGILMEHPEFTDKLKTAIDVMEKEQQARLPLNDEPENKVYDGFWTDSDQQELETVRTADPEGLTDVVSQLKNKRIRELVPHYKARNFPQSLTDEEKAAWEKHRKQTLLGGGDKSKYAQFMAKLQDIAKNRSLSSDDEYLMTELQLYAESIVPFSDEED